MSKKVDPRLGDYLSHILVAIERIDRYTFSLDRTGFECADQTQDAVIRNFEVIGEACRNIQRRYPEFARKHAEVPWEFAYEMRNALAHGYFKVDLGIVWETIQIDLPKLATRVKALRDEMAAERES